MSDAGYGLFMVTGEFKRGKYRKDITDVESEGMCGHLIIIKVSRLGQDWEGERVKDVV